MLTKLELCFSALTHFYLTGLISLDCPLSTNPFTKSLERFLYLSKVQQTRFILNAWLSGILFLSERGGADFA